MLPGKLGKPRPAVIVQSDAVPAVHMILVCPITSDLAAAPRYRMTLAPDAINNLTGTSQIMVDKIYCVDLAKCRGPNGALASEQLAELGLKLLIVLGLDRI